jgi:serine/threonine protein kinase
MACETIAHGGRVFAVERTHVLLGGALTVYKACERGTADYYDIDLVERARVDWARVEAGFRLAQGLSALHVTPVLGIFEPDGRPGFSAVLTRHDGDHYSWTRLCAGQPAVDEDDAIAILHGLIDAIAYLHAQQIALRGLAPEHIFVSQLNDVRLTGFHAAQRYAADAGAAAVKDELFRAGLCVHGLAAEPRSPEFRELLQRLIAEREDERWSLQELLDHRLLKRGLLDAAIEQAAWFRSFSDIL